MKTEKEIDQEICDLECLLPQAKKEVSDAEEFGTSDFIRGIKLEYLRVIEAKIAALTWVKS